MKPIYIVYFIIGLLIALLVYSQIIDPPGAQPNPSPPITDSLLVNTYPKLYDAIYAREARRLDPFIKHDSASIQQQAWRALASTPIDSINKYIEQAMESGLREAWLALSLHTINPEQLRLLERYWLDTPAQRSGISLVLGRTGDRTTLEFLLQNMEQVRDADYEFDSALALGRLLLRFKVDETIHQKILEQAFLTDDSEIIRAYLYSFYRGNRQQMNQETQGLLYRLWKDYGLGKSEEVDQYVVRLLADKVFYEVTLFENSEDNLDIHIQLAVELAQAVSRLEMTQRNKLATRILLGHENPHVVQQTLQNLEGKLQGSDELQDYIESEMIADTTSDPFVWLQAMETVPDLASVATARNKKRLEAIAKTHPYYLSQVHRVWQKMESTDEYLNRIQEILDQGDSYRSLQAVNALSEYWSSLPEEEHSVSNIDKVRELVFTALSLNDRSVAYAAGELLSDSDLFKADDFQRINRSLATFQLPEDIEVYQRFGDVYKQQFEEQAAPIVDSLAALGYAPLNRSLIESGWSQVPAPEETSVEFRKPNWDRIWELGRRPTWVLQTEKGFIRVEMHTLSAPATISAIDSLTRANAYDGVPFHRVIPNFVIQGGDIERKDGFGGPDFIIPTESSERSFRRGAAGIASAGTDTEGSQYFFMHQWKPHLDGSYTLFGHVTEGMDVVDRILPGDNVLYAYWE